jgi:hypothetical protein
MNSNNLPLYDEKKESLTKYICKINDILFERKKNIHNDIYNFIKLWLKKYNINISCLLDFKNIKESTITNNTEYNISFLNEHYSVLCKYLNKNDYSDDEDEYEHLLYEHNLKNDILLFIKELLKIINYKLVKNIKKSTYTIICK